MSSKSSTAFPDLPANAQLEQSFQMWWSLPGEWVESPNECRGGRSGVALCSPPEHYRSGSRLYLKRQINHVFRNWRHPIAGLPTAVREARFLDQMRKLALRVPVTAYSGSRNAAGDQYAILATEALDGFTSLDDFYSESSDSGFVRKADPLIKTALADYLARMHHARLQHGCLYPKHIFVRLSTKITDPSAEIALIDLEKMRYRVSPTKAGSRDLEQLRRHQNFWAGQAWDEFKVLYADSLKRLASPAQDLRNRA